jgi:hypothetical protein
MSSEEKSVWIMGVVAVATYGIYVSTILSLADGPIHEVAYAWPMVWAILSAIVAAIVLHIIVAAVWPRDAGKKDTRDKEIARFGDVVGSGFVAAGAIAAMIMAMLEWDLFWIANVIYLGFMLSAVVATVAKVVAYRGGFPRW